MREVDKLVNRMNHTTEGVRRDIDGLVAQYHVQRMQLSMARHEVKAWHDRTGEVWSCPSSEMRRYLEAVDRLGKAFGAVIKEVDFDTSDLSVEEKVRRVVIAAESWTLGRGQVVGTIEAVGGAHDDYKPLSGGIPTIAGFPAVALPFSELLGGC